MTAVEISGTQDLFIVQPMWYWHAWHYLSHTLYDEIYENHISRSCECWCIHTEPDSYWSPWMLPVVPQTTSLSYSSSCIRHHDRVGRDCFNTNPTSSDMVTPLCCYEITYDVIMVVMVIYYQLLLLSLQWLILVKMSFLFLQSVQNTLLYWNYWLSL